ncbi:YXWGXW repeat-containing protein [Ideonella sp. A 288]|uniref:YXWGXW repeat-containing protein n=1 Tax=Ideonella sp. A 288 TaxID=1962181 RepID=UPI000B4B6C33|nr:YXWGXW repeat-containing protein [Ideonella sp. A 288]
MPSPTLHRRRATLVLAGGLALALAGCVVAPVGGTPYGGGYPAAGEVVDTPPPAPQYELVGVAPVAGHLWLGGYWGWRGGRYHWVPGQWAAPRHGHAWVPHGWGRVGRGWRFNPGYWRRH